MEEEVILSLDVSTTATGFAVLVGRDIKCSGTLSSKDSDWLGRVRSMYNVLSTIGTMYKFTHVVIEDSYFSKNIKTVKKLCMAQGLLLGAFPQAKLVQVYPTTWKSYYGLTKGGSKRKEQKQTSLSILDTMKIVSNGTDDEADAILMGLYVVDNKEDLL